MNAKSDTFGAENAARGALSGLASSTANTAYGVVAMEPFFSLLQETVADRKHRRTREELRTWVEGPSSNEYETIMNPAVSLAT